MSEGFWGKIGASWIIGNDDGKTEISRPFAYSRDENGKEFCAAVCHEFNKGWGVSDLKPGLKWI